jgi:hypothetical protein
MSDVTAVVLTIGEPSTSRALASVRAQSQGPATIVVVDSVTPFHKALTMGASRVETDFFIQVDADMILDRHCVEDLRGWMAPGVGIVQGPLADPLVGIAAGVKLFRTGCLREVALRDSISPDTDFIVDIAARGWERRTVLNTRPNGRAPGLWHTFGEHSPDYTPLYTYWKFKVLGSRFRHRRDLLGVQWRLWQMDRQRHSASLIAQLALGHGVFFDASHDLLAPYGESPEYRHLMDVLEGNGRVDVPDEEIRSLLDEPAWEQYLGFSVLGSRLAGGRDGGAVRQCLGFLQEVPVQRGWLARVALGHGLCLDRPQPDQLRSEYAAIRRLFDGSPAWDHVETGARR